MRPNILFLFSDQHRGDWMPYDSEIKAAHGITDLKLHMPVIRGLMDRGTSFSLAFSPAPVCAPARACLAAGKRYKNCRVYHNNVNYDAALPNFYGKLRNAGYIVCGAGKFDLNKADLDWGDGYHKLLQEMGFSNALDSEGKMDTVWAVMRGAPGPYGQMLKEAGWLDAHVEDMSHRGASHVVTPLPDEYYADNWVAAKSADMLRDMPKDNPWFMQVNFSGPHDPWDITKSMREAVEGRSFPPAVNCKFEEANLEVRKNYAAMIENIDRLCGELIDVVKERGELENTLIVYASDHGEMMGDHGLYGKSKPDMASVHIPLVIDASCLDGKAALTNTTPVELQDLAATFLDYAGIPMADSLESMSLRPVVEGHKEKVRDYAISELIRPNPCGLINSFGTITDGRWKFIMATGQPDRLYDISIDPFETNDVAAENPEIVENLRTAFGERGQRRNPIAALYAKSFSAI